jgi:hypothetical protein
MKLKIRPFLGSCIFAGALFSAPFSGAQQVQTPGTQTYTRYDASRETTLTGRVISYTAASAVPPVGAHMSVQTVYGPVDVHLGSAKLLEQNHFTVSVGDSIRVTGEVVSLGSSSTFAARIVEDGSQSITVRDTKGRLIQMSPVHVVRGVR